MPAEALGLITIGIVALLTILSLVLYLRSRPIDLIDPTTGDRVLPEVLESDVPPDLPDSAWRRFPTRYLFRWPRF
jgi:hypothetical protein